MTIEFTLNGQPVSAQAQADDSLYTMLRALNIASVKCGCETTNCGLCTVHLNGRAVLSCSVPAPRAAGQQVVTLEGLQAQAREFGGYLADEGAEQCGFCAPGLIMNVLALAKENPHATDAQADTYLAGNLCRCSGYMGQRRAIRRYLDALAARESGEVRA